MLCTEFDFLIKIHEVRFDASVVVKTGFGAQAVARDEHGFGLPVCFRHRIVLARARLRLWGFSVAVWLLPICDQLALCGPVTLDFI